MGSTHAVYLLMTIRRAGVKKTRDILWKSHQITIALLSDPAVLREGAVVTGRRAAVYFHVDDFVVMAGLKAVATLCWRKSGEI